MNRLLRALSHSFMSEYATQVVAFASIMVVVRVLTPAEVGIFSVALAFMIIIQELSRFGVGQYVVQEKELSEERLRAAVGVMFITCWGFAALVAMASGFVAAFYDEPAVQAVLLVMCCSLVVMPFTGVIQGCLMRDMRFDRMMWIRVGSQLCHSAALIALAFAGFGHMSMAWAALVGTCVSVAIANAVRPEGAPWKPGFAEIRRVLGFGVWASARGVCLRMGEAVPELVIGRVLDFAAVGQFSRGLGLIFLFKRAVTQAVQPVALPHFAEEVRSKGGAGPAYLRVVSYMTVVAWPFYGVLAILAPEVVHVLYGDQWGPAVPVAQLLCAWGAAEAIFVLGGDALIATGRVRWVFLKELAVLVLKAVAVIWVAARGIEAVAVAFSAVGLLELGIVLALLRSAFGVRLLEVARACSRSAVVAAICLAPVAGTRVLLGDAQPDVVVLALTGTVALAAWGAAIVLVGHPLAQKVRAAVAAVGGLASGHRGA